MIPGHWTNNCVQFRYLIQRAIKYGRLKFEDKSATKVAIDKDPFPMNSAFVELVLIPINVVGFREVDEKKYKTIWIWT